MTIRQSKQHSGASPAFRPVGSQVSFPELEERVLAFWRESDVFRRSQHEGGGQVDEEKPLFMFYEGPPTANGPPGIHHVFARVFKDVIPRYKTMQGYRIIRKGGWDTHGLPVELEVEKELGLSSKQEIEAYGIDRFNARCRESVMRHVKAWEDLTDRIGYWVDMKDAYATFANSYIETGWWILKQLWDKGLVYEGMKGTPHCPRCVTSLSSHEVALGYQEDTPDPSVFIRFRFDAARTLDLAATLPGPKGERLQSAAETLQRSGRPVFFLAWTTTPWTLPGNTGLAVDAESAYVLVSLEGEDGLLLLASPLAEKVLEGGSTVEATLRGEELEGLRYEPLYDPFDAGLPRASLRRFEEGAAAPTAIESPGGRETPGSERSWQVHVADFVSMDDGSGIVHVAPAFGQEDYLLGTQKRLLFVQNVDVQGRIVGDYPGTGLFVKEADELIMRDLTDRGLLYRREVYRHTYPFCWRCDAPLLYYSKPSWYIQTTARRERLVSANREINWRPEHIKEGRFGEWLRNNVDWAISRERYWGTPLPIWRCEGCGETRCFGSVAELRESTDDAGRATLDAADFDLHRPYIDRVTASCGSCGATMRRVPEVIDVWYDSGAMPYAQYHYPFESPSLMEDGRFPAEYICEAVDQTRGWFYSLHALGVLLTDSPAYRNVICLGHILDEGGLKMSKSRGNIVEPWAVITHRGADALRWYLYSSAPPGNSRRFSESLVGESVRRFLLTLWNTYSFFVTYANLDGFRPATGVPEGLLPLDRWALSELHSLVQGVTADLESYNPTDAARRIEGFVDVLSTWYVRRSRRRFWKSTDDAEKEAAHQTLYACLTTLARLLAPFTPFLAEELYGNLVRSVDPNAPDSVHLAAWPEADELLIDQELSQSTRLVMRLASMGRAARSKAGIRVRQPLATLRVAVRSADEVRAVDGLRDQLLDELNVKEIAAASGSAGEEELWDWELGANMAVIGPKYGPRTGEIAAAIGGMDAREVAARLQAGHAISLPQEALRGGPVELTAEEVSLTKRERAGYSIVEEGGYVVALETALTPELAQEGLARELVHRVQNLRRSAGLDISDRITLFWQGPEAVRDVLSDASMLQHLQGETLALSVMEGPAPEDAHSEAQKMDGMEVTLAVRKA